MSDGERLTSDELASLIGEALASGRRVHVGFTDAVLLDTPENDWARMALARMRADTTGEDTQQMPAVEAP